MQHKNERQERGVRALAVLISVIPESYVLSYHLQCLNVQFFLGCHQPVPIKFKLGIYSVRLYTLGMSPVLGTGDAMMMKTQSQVGRVLCFGGKRQMQKKEYQCHQYHAGDIITKEVLMVLQEHIRKASKGEVSRLPCHHVFVTSHKLFRLFFLSSQSPLSFFQCSLTFF